LQLSILIWQSPVPMTIHLTHDETTHDLRAEDESKSTPKVSLRVRVETISYMFGVKRLR